MARVVVVHWQPPDALRICAARRAARRAAAAAASDATTRSARARGGGSSRADPRPASTGRAAARPKASTRSGHTWKLEENVPCNVRARVVFLFSIPLSLSPTRKLPRAGDARTAAGQLGHCGAGEGSAAPLQSLVSAGSQYASFSLAHPHASCLADLTCQSVLECDQAAVDLRRTAALTLFGAWHSMVFRQSLSKSCTTAFSAQRGRSRTR